MNPPMHRTLLMATKSLAVHKLQAGLSALGIVFAVVAVVMMLAIAEGAKQDLMRQIALLGTNTLIVRQLPLTDRQWQKAAQSHSGGLTAADVRLLGGAVAAVAASAPVRYLREHNRGWSRPGCIRYRECSDEVVLALVN